MHALSLGETRGAQPLVQELLKRRWPVILTHTTATGRREGARLFGVAIDSGQLRQAWLYDTPGACKRFLEEVAPSCGILIEREVLAQHDPRSECARRAHGPCQAHACRNAPPGGGRYAGRVLRDAYAGLDRVLARPSPMRRACEPAARATRRSAATSNSIWRFPPTRRPWAAPGAKRRRRVVVVASTHEGEEAAFLQAYASRAWPDGGRDAPLLILVPRHPERFDAVAAQLAETRLRWVRRSAIDLLRPLPEGTQIMLGDSMGELAAYYAAGDVAIVAGSFVARAART